MEVKDFTWDTDSVRWNFKGNKIDFKLPNINFANLDLDQGNIYIVSGENFSENQVHYISFAGKKIFEYDKILGNITWEYKGKKIEVNCNQIENARLYVEEEIVMVITRLEQGKEKLLGFNLNGVSLFEQDAPADYQLIYLASVDNKPSVVCESSDNSADSYGRNRWHFIIDTKKGELIKSNLAY